MYVLPAILCKCMDGIGETIWEQLVPHSNGCIGSHPCCKPFIYLPSSMDQTIRSWGGNDVYDVPVPGVVIYGVAPIQIIQISELWNRFISNIEVLKQANNI